MYEAVAPLVDEHLRVAAFPDGSVDAYAPVRDGDDGRLSTSAFRERVGDARSRTFRLGGRTLEPGGQAVNAVRQAHALGDAVRLDGCLDDDRLTFAFETRSFSEPTRVDVHKFDDGDVVYAAVSDDVAGWTHEAFDGLPGADAYVCGNWASVDGITGSLHALADRLGDGGEADPDAFVFDPGDWTDAPAAALRECASALAALDGAVAVAVSVDGRELAALADALGVDDEPGAVRPETGVSAVVRHEADAAAGATRDGERSVPTPDVDDVARRTGAGDRFDAGLAHGLAAGGGLGAALALGNCCASYYVATGETSTGEQLAAFADERAP
jgi:sugar/nucleoside kinase (ribokinase family)